MYVPSHRYDRMACVEEVKPMTLLVKLDMGEDYNLGKYVFAAGVTAVVTAHSDYPGTTQTWTVPYCQYRRPGAVDEKNNQC